MINNAKQMKHASRDQEVDSENCDTSHLNTREATDNKYVNKREAKRVSKGILKNPNMDDESVVREECEMRVGEFVKLMTHIVTTYTETNDEVKNSKQNMDSRLFRAMGKAKKWVSLYDIKRVKEVFKELFRDSKPAVKTQFKF